MKKPANPAALENPVAKGIKSMNTQVRGAIQAFSVQIPQNGPSLQDGAAAAMGLLGQAADQINNVMTELANGAGQLGTEAVQEFERIMRILNIRGMIDTFVQLLNSIVEATARLFLKFLQEVKKVIRVLWELVFGDMPKWFETVLLLIDELAKHAIEALFPKLAGELSAGEVMYLNEVRAARQISLLGKSPNTNDDK